MDICDEMGQGGIGLILISGKNDGARKTAGI
jgi:hypothetical protein